MDAWLIVVCAVCCLPLAGVWLMALVLYFDTRLARVERLEKKLEAAYAERSKLVEENIRLKFNISYDRAEATAAKRKEAV